MIGYRTFSSRSLFWTAIKLLISLACLFALWRWIDPSRLSSDLKGMIAIPFAIAVALNLILQVFNAIKIRLLFPAPRPALAGMVTVNFIAVFFSTFIPGGIGGEVARWAYLGRESGSKSRALAAILLDRITGLWAQTFLAVAAWLWLERNSLTLKVAVPGALLVLGGSMGAGIWGYRGLTRVLSKLGVWYARKRGEEGAGPEDISAALADLLASRGHLLQVVGLSLANHAVVVATFLFIDRSIGGNLGLAQALVFLFGYTAILLLPVTFGNWGLSEGILGIFYHYAGAQSSTGVLISLLLRAMNLPAAALGWIFFLTRRSKEARLDHPAAMG